jgi:hypothetical protein
MTRNSGLDDYRLRLARAEAPALQPHREGGMIRPHAAASGPHMLSGLRILDLGTMVPGRLPPRRSATSALKSSRSKSHAGATPCVTSALRRWPMPVLERGEPEQEIDHAGPAQAGGSRPVAASGTRGCWSRTSVRAPLRNGVWAGKRSRRATLAHHAAHFRLRANRSLSRARRL